jgi:N-acylneuraminate cytidylyltransferase
MNIVIVIPARGGSKGVIDKNVYPLMGMPLIGHTILEAKQSKLADRIVVSTEDEKISTCAKNYGIQVIPRPPEYATDAAPIEWALRHVVRYLEGEENYSADIIVWLQANVPIRKEGQIDNVIKKLIDTHADSVLTVIEVSQRPEAMKKIVDGDRIIHMARPKETRRQEFKETLYIADGAVIAIRKTVLMETENLTGGHVYLGNDIRAVIEDPRYAIEIDDHFDLEVAEGILLVEQKRAAGKK